MARGAKWRNEANKRRRAKRVWNLLVKKRSVMEEEPEVHESEWDRFERHMKPIREAQKHNDY